MDGAFCVCDKQLAADDTDSTDQLSENLTTETSRDGGEARSYRCPYPCHRERACGSEATGGESNDPENTSGLDAASGSPHEKTCGTAAPAVHRKEKRTSGH